MSHEEYAPEDRYFDPEEPEECCNGHSYVFPDRRNVRYTIAGQLICKQCKRDSEARAKARKYNNYGY